jgi:membrane protein implicated in regulation of membrane protease activity
VFYVYVFAAIVGSVMLVASLLGGHHGIDHDMSGAGGHGDGDGDDADSFALRIFSVRVFTYLLAFGGITGALLRAVAHVTEPVAALVSLAVGAAAGVMAQSLFQRALRSGARGTVTRVDLVGRAGDVIVPFGRGQTGKVRVHVKGGDVDLLAVTEDEAAMDARDEVLVVEIRDGNALVTRSPTKR